MWSFPSGSKTKTVFTFLIASTRATNPAHLTLLDSIILIISDEKYKVWSSSLRWLKNIATHQEWRIGEWKYGFSLT
jgi:hypothetical protein